jgi:ribosome biogenesis GTPase A
MICRKNITACLLATAMITLPIFASEEAKEDGEGASARTRTRTSTPDLKELLQVGISKAKQAEGKDAVFVLGNTGVGKSTTIAYLMGAKFKWNEDEERIEIEDQVGFPPIGHGIALAHTLYPEPYTALYGLPRLF